MAEPAITSDSKSVVRAKAGLDKSLRPILKGKSTQGPSSLLGGLRGVQQEVIDLPKPDMAASFLQFCAMCEKQIMTPCNSILYCSEACRRKDGAKPLSAATITSISPPASVPSSPCRPVLSHRSCYTDVPVVRIPAELHGHQSDLDPTEWKPKLPNRAHSDAYQYLSRYHRSTTPLDVQRRMNHETTNIDFFDPASLPTPILGFSPTTTVASSLSTSTGLHTNMNSYAHGYDFSTRPLPPRPSRWYSTSNTVANGIDLVTPHIVPLVNANAADQAHETEDIWARKVAIHGPSTSSQKGLGALFSNATMMK